MEPISLNEGRTRKACLQCYQKKIRCVSRPASTICVRCEAHGLECVPVESSQRRPRLSMRGGLEDLSSRVNQLEAAVFSLTSPDAFDVQASGSSNDAFTITTDPDDLQAKLQHHKSSPASKILSIAKSYRGTTSPWSVLVNHLQASHDPELDLLRNDAIRIADEERSSAKSSDIPYDLLRKFPQLTQDVVYRYIRAYATDAPYPILQYELLFETAGSLLNIRGSTHWGQIVCILMYMAFGSTLSPSSMASVEELQEEASLYLNEALNILPHLIMQRDLWALKGLTLIIHYLQASSKPEPCWDLLGTACRMAISLGFHQKNVILNAYNPIEAEEGKRAWWLCYVMDKTFCAIFGYPNVTGFDMKTFNAENPMPFESSTEDNTIFGANEVTAVQFFHEIIALTNNRDSALRNDPEALTPESLSRILHDILHVSLRSPDDLSLSALPLRSSISALAQYNAVLVLSFRLSPLTSFPSLTLVSARTSLRIILETRSKGTTMCLWMWLHYAFTASVVLFVFAISHPRHDDVVLDLALIEELRALCEVFRGSEASRRVATVCGRMEEVGWRFVKRAARKRSAQDNEEAENEKGKGRKLPRTSAGPEDVSAGISEDIFGPFMSADTVPDNETVGDMESRILETAPEAFEWDQWFDWLDQPLLQ